MKTIRGEASGGIPWLAILDEDGKVLATSTDNGEASYGFPTEPEEVERFVRMLRKTGSRFTDDNAVTISAALSSKSK